MSAMGPRILNPTPASMLRQAPTVLDGWSPMSNSRLMHKLARFFDQDLLIHPDRESEWPTSRLA